MSISFDCSGCAKSYTVPVSNAGKRTKCPACDTMLVVPALQSAGAEDAAYAMLADDPEPSLEPVERPRREAEKDTPVAGVTRFNVPVSPNRPGSGPGPAAQPRKVRVPRYEEAEERPRRRGLSISPGIWAGVGMLVGGTIWLVAGLAAGRLFFYAPILMVIGLFKIVAGLLGYGEE